MFLRFCFINKSLDFLKKEKNSLQLQDLEKVYMKITKVIEIRENEVFRKHSKVVVQGL